ncbi:MRN complex-interacting protein isoform X2 [Pristis pectinata]|uniref:MRN complex-interacting protein isoform X2 n=1 Tax=Pristis pectinata TaxID=685728 RepID=UPI00223D8EFB|nr:MRN complex-interacting protein isoform X2 [Pristis pectinata]
METAPGGSSAVPAMAPQFQALRCCSCLTYQVQQVKKSKKWNCKLCGEKQSVLKVYGQGSGADCRQHVQKLNMLRGLKMQAMEATTRPIEERAYSSDHCQPQTFSAVCGQSQATSRWNIYLDQKPAEEPFEEGGEDGEVVYTDRQQFQADMRNASRDRSKRKRGSHLDPEKLDPYGHCTDSNGKETARKKMKQVNGSRNGNPEIGEGSDILNQSKLDFNSAVQLGNKSRSDKAFLTKQPKASRWDRFLPLSRATGSELFNQSTVNSGQQVWTQDSPSTHFPLTCSLPEDQDDDVGRSALSDCSVLTGDTWLCVSPTTGTATEKVVTSPLNAACAELVEGASGTVDSPELSSDSKRVSNNACGAGKDGQAQKPFPEFMLHAAGVSGTLKPGTSSSLLALTHHQPSAGGSPALNTKQPCFMSLFQMDEDFDDL